MNRRENNRENAGGKFIVLCLVLFSFFLCAHQAEADTMRPVDDAFIKNCVQNSGGGYNFDDNALTGPIVYCIQYTIQNAVSSALQKMSDYFWNPAAALFVLAITIHGARILSGERGLNAKNMMVMLKIGFAAAFCYNLAGLAGYVFGIMGEMVSLVIGGYSPWTMIDSILGVIFGFAPGFALFQGLAWLGMGLTSGTSNVAMATGLIVTFIELILFVVEIVYVYLTAYIVVAFMLILSPMFVPLLIFQNTERYFKRWLDTIFGAMLVPVLLFALLYFSLVLFVPRINAVIQAVLPNYTAIVLPIDPNNPPTPPDFSQFGKINQAMSLFSPINMGVDPDLLGVEQAAMNRSGHAPHMHPTSHTIVNPFSRGGFTGGGFSPSVVNFGIHNNSISQKLLLNLIALWLYAAILKELIEKMPGIAQQIAGVTPTIVMRAPKLQEKVNEVKESVLVGGSTLVGGIAGGQLGAASGSRRVTAAGAIGGGIIGNVLARKAL